MKDKRVDALIATLMPCQCSWWYRYSGGDGDVYYCSGRDRITIAECGGDLAKCELEDKKDEG